jgi:tetratricopeptide (TPR) repeat protein
LADPDRIAEFKEVAELMPDDPVVRFGLAGAYLEAGQAESAIVEYEEAIRLKPDYSAAHRGLGRALERAGRTFEDVVSGDLHRAVGDYPGPGHRMPLCCSVMTRAMRPGDRIVAEPPSGKGATLTIRYRLPRE